MVLAAYRCRLGIYLLGARPRGHGGAFPYLRCVDTDRACCMDPFLSATATCCGASMTAPLNALDALDMIPGWDREAAAIEELKGGRTNRVYHIRSNGQECVMRLATDQSGTFDLDRSCEVPILETAGEAGIAPAILYSNPDAGILMTEYLHGKVWQESDLESRENIEALAATAAARTRIAVVLQPGRSDGDRRKIRGIPGNTSWSACVRFELCPNYQRKSSAR